MARKGLSGEMKSVAQWLPATWNQRSREVLGYVAPITRINEEYVLAHTVQSYFDKGYTAYEYALIHNGGEVKEKRGVNKYKQSYDSGSYARDVLQILTKKAYAEEN